MPLKQSNDADLHEQLATMMTRLEAMQLEINALWSQSSTLSPGPSSIESLLNEPAESIERDESVEPVEPAEPAEPTELAEPAEPTGPAGPAELAEPKVLKDPHERIPLSARPLNASNGRTLRPH